MTTSQISSLEISDNTALILFIIIQSIYTLILFPLTVLYTKQLWKLHKQKVLFITKRRPQSVLFCVALLNIYPVIIRLITDLPRICSALKQFDNFYIRMILVDIIHLLIYGLFSRIWLLFYDFERNIALMSIEWKTRIMKQQNYMPWTVKYKFLGNTKVIFIITVIVWICLMFIIQFGCYTMGEHYANQLQLIIVIPPILGAIIIAIKIRKYNDTIYLKKELQLMALVGFILFFVFICIIFPFEYNIQLLITNIIICAYCYSLAFISTQWVIHKYNKQRVETPSDKQLSIEYILSDRVGFTLFANYLVKQFSIEHILFLFEIMKLKNELITAEVISKKEAGILIPMNYKDITYNSIKSKSINEIKDDLKYIIDEYIDLYSEQSVNISARIRKNILKIKSLLDDDISHTISDISMEEIGSGLNNINEQQIKVHLKEMTNNSDIKDIDNDKIQKMNTNSSTDCNQFDIVSWLNKFDGAVEEVIKLLTCDSLNKFYETVEYQQMIKDQTFVD